MAEHILIQDFMTQSGVKFGTSGARGLVSKMTDRVCFAYTVAFLQHLSSGGLRPGCSVYLAGDRRPSTPAILHAVARAAQFLGYVPVNCGLIPSPAVALLGLKKKAPSIMVTGSHIPDDRNGIKFNSPLGEITKRDEAGIFSQAVTLPDWFLADGSIAAHQRQPLPAADREARKLYLNRYLSLWGSDPLEGSTIGVYGHSAVGRELLVELYESLGAAVTPLDFSEEFVPVDTEAIRSEDIELARQRAAEQDFDAIVSTDGDSDRPLISDEKGEWIRGDVAGIVTAQFLNADAVATPVSCNTAVDRMGFGAVLRSRIGSPYVIEKMVEARRAGFRRIVGYEANGGFLIFSDLPLAGGKTLEALPTRDAVIVQLSLILAARARKIPLSQLIAQTCQRHTESDRDQSFENARSAQLMSLLLEGDTSRLTVEFALGEIVATDFTDGARFTFDSEEIVHLRPSGNAPELRCYAEAESAERAAELVQLGLAVARRLAP